MEKSQGETAGQEGKVGPPIPQGDTYNKGDAKNKGDIYENLVLWYHFKSLNFHAVSLVVIVILNCISVAWIISQNKGPGNSLPIPVNCTSQPRGYEFYTPVYWVLALSLGLVSLFIARYSHVWQIEETATGTNIRIREVGLNRGVQKLILFGSLLLLAVEFLGIAWLNFTISAVVRDWAVKNPVIYWLGGWLTALLCGIIIDLQGIPRLTRFVLVVWIAVLAHIFWWITPA